MKLFNIAEKSLEENVNLEQVVILKRMFRCDPEVIDPLGMKSKLSEYGNNLLEEIWMTKGCPKNIIIASQALGCDGQLRVDRFGPLSAKNYDGTHMRGRLAVQHYTASIINIFLDVFPNLGKKKVTLEHKGSNFSEVCNDRGQNSYSNRVKRSQGNMQSGGVNNRVNQGSFKQYENPTSAQNMTQYTQNHWTGQTTTAGMGAGKRQSDNAYFYNVKTSNMFTASGN